MLRRTLILQCPHVGPERLYEYLGYVCGLHEGDEFWEADRFLGWQAAKCKICIAFAIVDCQLVLFKLNKCKCELD